MPEDTAKYRKIFEQLRREIRDGCYPCGEPLPSEEALVRKFKVSRITRLSTFGLGFNFFRYDNLRLSACGAGFAKLPPRKTV